jgi:hypothetical protein
MWFLLVILKNPKDANDFTKIYGAVLQKTLNAFVIKICF